MAQEPRASSSGVIANLRRIVRAIHEQSAAIEGATGLTGPQLWALREVAGDAAGLSIGEVGRRLQCHKTSAGRIVERLLRAGLVRAEKAARDRRVVLVRATRAGRELAARPIAGPPQANLLARLDSLGPREVARLEAALERLVELLGAEAIEPAPLFDEPRAGRGRRRRGR